MKNWDLKESYPGQFVYKMISVVAIDKDLETRLAGQRFYTVELIGIGMKKLHLKFVDAYDQEYISTPISSFGYKDNGNFVQVTTATAQFTLQIVGGQGIRRSKAGLYEWDNKS